VPPRAIRVVFQERWAPPRAKGLLDVDPKVRTLLKVILSYPEVRHVLPAEVSLEAGAEPHLLETLRKFIGRQGWLVKRVDIT
jgi:hypothetical protein